MSVESNIARMCKQTAVYWGNPVNDGYGTCTFDPPIEIPCRWEDRNETFLTPNGNTGIAKSVVYVLENLHQDGYLFLGTFDDLESYAVNPIEIEKANIIRRFDKLPALGSTTAFIRKAYLTSKNMV